MNTLQFRFLMSMRSFLGNTLTFLVDEFLNISQHLWPKHTRTTELTHSVRTNMSHLFVKPTINQISQGFRPNNLLRPIILTTQNPATINKQLPSVMQQLTHRRIKIFPVPLLFHLQQLLDLADNVVIFLSRSYLLQ